MWCIFTPDMPVVDDVKYGSNTSTRMDQLRAIPALFKLRLATLVVLSSVLGYFTATTVVDWRALGILCLGGFLLTGASNGLNQVWERDIDELMERTRNRPIPTGVLSPLQATVISSIAGILGIALLGWGLNFLSGVLGTLAVFMYVFLYTPLKKHSSLAVFVGAFPGAIPPMLGYVACTGDFGIEPGSLFAMQFVWQFPHFWAIAWVAQEDYARAGYQLLPFAEGRTSKSAFIILCYTLLLIPVSLMPWVFPAEAPIIGHVGAGLVLASGAVFAWHAWKLFRYRDVKHAKQLMIASFLYLPLVQLVYVFA